MTDADFVLMVADEPMTPRRMLAVVTVAAYHGWLDARRGELGGPRYSGDGGVFEDVVRLLQDGHELDPSVTGLLREPPTPT